MAPSSFLVATAIFSITIIFIQPIARAASVVLDTRQTTDPNGPPHGWTFVGCYDDQGTARTLKAQSLVNNTGMTPAMCLEFCSNFTFPYGFAGLEFGQECWCDGVIQLTANLTDSVSGECDIPCIGDNKFICGGSDRISIYTNGTPSPKIPTVATRPEADDALPIGIWQYAGCYSDSFANRTLGHSFSHGVGNDANSCAAVCEDAFPDSSKENVVSPKSEKSFLFSGVEFGGECWCGTSISSQAQILPDIACASMGCFGLNDQACGGELVIAVYQFNPLLEFNDCEGEVFFTPFQLNAVFVDEPSKSVPITMTSLILHTSFGVTETVPNAGILSYCPTCPNPVTFELTLDSQWEINPIINADTAINNLTVIHPAGTANFVEITDDDKLFVGYCAAHSIIHPGLIELTAFGRHATPPLTGANEINNNVQFNLCSNLTAGGRLDIVPKVLTFQRGYNLTDCFDVVLEMNFNVTV